MSIFLFTQHRILASSLILAIRCWRARPHILSCTSAVSCSHYQQMKMISERENNLAESLDKQVATRIKESLCYVNKNNWQTLDWSLGFEEASFTLPDGHSVTLGTERFRCAEPLFTPSLIEQQVGGITELCFNSIMKSDVDIRHLVCNSIVISGGSSLFEGLPERLFDELRKLVPQKYRVGIWASHNRRHAAWCGAYYFFF